MINWSIFLTIQKLKIWSAVRGSVFPLWTTRLINHFQPGRELAGGTTVPTTLPARKWPGDSGRGHKRYISQVAVNRSNHGRPSVGNHAGWQMEVGSTCAGNIGGYDTLRRSTRSVTGWELNLSTGNQGGVCLWINLVGMTCDGSFDLVWFYFF